MSLWDLNTSIIVLLQARKLPCICCQYHLFPESMIRWRSLDIAGTWVCLWHILKTLTLFRNQIRVRKILSPEVFSTIHLAYQIQRSLSGNILIPVYWVVSCLPCKQPSADIEKKLTVLGIFFHGFLQSFVQGMGPEAAQGLQVHACLLMNSRIYSWCSFWLQGCMYLCLAETVHLCA
jgi:hypothetical protein